MLYGGLGADGKPLNDAWVLDLELRAWSLIYLGHPDLCPPQVSQQQCVPGCNNISEALPSLAHVAAAVRMLLTAVNSAQLSVVLTGCGGHAAWQQAGLPRFSCWQPQARPGNVVGHSSNSGKQTGSCLISMSVLSACVANETDVVSYMHASA